MKRCLFIGLFVVGVVSGAAQAQTLPVLRGTNAAHYRFADPSDLTIEVKVWGGVNNPGLYEVRENLNLSTLLSLAGGPRTTGQSGPVKRTLAVRLYRLQAGDRYQLFTETIMENELGMLAQDPILKHGDMLIAEEKTRQRLGWRDGVSILTAVATVVLVIDNAFLK